MKSTVYIETTVISYLTAWPSRDVVRLAQQQTTRDWWNSQRQRFDLVASELVVLECAAGDKAAASDRLKVIEPLPLLAVNGAATEVADALLVAKAIPRSADRDALHVGICAVHQVPFLLTWNFKHLANAQMQDSIRDVCIVQGYAAPVICTPEALFEDSP